MFWIDDYDLVSRLGHQPVAAWSEFLPQQ